MLCDQQVATSFSVRDILDFNENNNLMTSASDVDISIVHNNASATGHPILEPMMAINPLDSEMSASNYYTNYWLENNHNHDARAMMAMEEHQAPPAYASLHHNQQQLPHHQSQMPIEPLPTHYEYPVYNYMGYSCLPEDCNRFNEDEEVKMVGSQNRSISRPLTTSHHVQQLSHLCPPFSDQDNSSNTNHDINSSKNKLNSRKFDRE